MQSDNFTLAHAGNYTNFTVYQLVQTCTALFPPAWALVSFWRLPLLGGLTTIQTGSLLSLALPPALLFCLRTRSLFCSEPLDPQRLDALEGFEIAAFRTNAPLLLCEILARFNKDSFVFKYALTFSILRLPLSLSNPQSLYTPDKSVTLVI